MKPLHGSWSLVSTIMLQAKSKGLTVTLILSHLGLRLFPKRPATKHHRTIDYHELPDLWKAVEASNAHGVTKALILTGMVTALRFGSIQKVRGEHLDLQTGVWAIPESTSPDSNYRMKSGQAFKLKLPPLLLEKIISLIPITEDSITPDSFIFASPTRLNRPVSETAVRKCLGSTRKNIAFHGFPERHQDLGKR